MKWFEDVSFVEQRYGEKISAENRELAKFELQLCIFAASQFAMSLSSLDFSFRKAYNG